MRTWLCWLVIVYCTVFSFGSKCGKKQNEGPVCIIGAGPSGLTAAWELETRGYQVVVLEKENQVGGKTRSIAHEDRIYNLGAFLNNANNLIVNKFIEMFNLTRIPYMSSVSLYDPQRPGLMIPIPNRPFLNQSLAFQQSVIDWLRIVSKYYDEVIEDDLIDFEPELAQPFDQFFQLDGIHASVKLLVLEFVYSFGYGRLSNYPTIQMLKYNPFQFFLTPSSDALNWLREGTQEVWNRLAGRLRDVRVNVDIHSIPPSSRTNTQTILQYTDRSDQTVRTLRCSKVIVAFPPVLENLNFLGLDSRETNMFSPVYYETYYTALVRIPGFRDESLISVSVSPNGQLSEPVVEDGDIVLLHKQYPDRDNVIVYGYMRGTVREFDANLAAQRIIGTVSFLGYGPITVSNIIDVFSWQYYPRVNLQQMPNYFTTLDEMQGYRGTYYVGGFLKFETVAHSAEQAQTLVRRMFPSKVSPLPN